MRTAVYFLSASAIFLAALLALMTVAGCGCAPPQVGRAEVVHEYERAVEILTLCPNGTGGRGSGVLLDDRHVLTAYHVVDCAGEGEPLISVRTQSDVVAVMVVEVVAESRDLARLETLPGVLPAVPPIALGPRVRAGDEVCTAPAVPSRDRQCGRVNPSEAGVIRHTALTQPGNSGGGLYDSQGRLVGIVTQLWMIFNGQVAGGNAAALADAQWLVRP